MASRISAFTSTSCGIGVSGSTKKISASISPFADQRADLLVAAERAAFQRRQVEAGAGGQDALAGRAGGDDVTGLEELDVIAGEGDHVVLLLVVGDEREAQCWCHGEAGPTG